MKMNKLIAVSMWTVILLMTFAVSVNIVTYANGEMEHKYNRVAYTSIADRHISTIDSSKVQKERVIDLVLKNDTDHALYTSMPIKEIETENHSESLLNTINLESIKSLFSNLEQPIDEVYENDIPLDTEIVSVIYFFDITNFQPSEEAYIDDIPFNTEEVIYQFNSNLHGVNQEAEEYIDDIPFDTNAIYNEYMRIK
jgi:hypothetical protein